VADGRLLSLVTQETKLSEALDSVKLMTVAPPVSECWVFVPPGKRPATNSGSLVAGGGEQSGWAG
jgi:hypothetical protein